MAVVKADAYGHGAVECSKRLVAEGVESLAVALAEEAVELRGSAIDSDIVVLGSFFPGQEAAFIQHKLEPVIYQRHTAALLNDAAAAAGVVVDIHIKIDTGMSRLGIDAADASDFADLLAKMHNLRVKGMMTHFPSADDPAQDHFTRAQIELFDRCCEAFTVRGHSPRFFDLANSPGALAHPASRKNLIRLGGGLYGLLDDIMRSHPALPRLEPVMSLRSAIANLRDVPAGTSVGYGRTFVTGRASKLAAVPIGYADGFPRGLSNKGAGLIRGQIAPVAGIVSMDWTVFDVTDIAGVEIGDEVVLIGRSGDRSISAADIAGNVDTIGYEITCGISGRVPRRYLP
jgi:alanine racemase